MQAKARILLKEVFSKELADRSPAGRLALAHKLLELASNSKDDNADQWILLVGAMQAAQETGNLQICFSAAEIMANQYKINLLGLKSDAVAKYRSQACTASENAKNVYLGLSVLDSLISAEDFSTAIRVGLALRTAARSDPALREKVQRALEKCGKVRAAREQIAPSREELKVKAEDPAANLAVGRYECLLLGHWETGLPLLAKGSDRDLARAAREDMATPKEAKAQAEVADAWWKLSEAQTNADRPLLQQRAAYWYRQAVPGLTGLQKAAAEKRIDLAPGSDVPNPDTSPRIVAYRSCDEIAPYLFPLGDAEIPDELAVVSGPHSMRIAGTKRSDAKVVGGRSAGHFGKGILIESRSATGTLDAGVDTTTGHTTYWLEMREKDGTTRHELLRLTHGTTYSWQLSESDSQVALVVRADGGSDQSIAVPAESFAFFGWAADTRHPEDRAELNIHFSPASADAEAANTK